MFGKKEKAKLLEAVERLTADNAALRARLDSAPAPAPAVVSESSRVEAKAGGGKGSGAARAASLLPACGPEDHAVYTSDRKFHSSGSWLARNWSWVTGFALRITSLATGKTVFSRVADVVGAAEKPE